MKENTIVFLILISFVVAENDCYKKGRTWSEEGKYTYLDSKLLWPVVCFLKKLFDIGLWVVWEEQFAPYTT